MNNIVYMTIHDLLTTLCHYKPMCSVPVPIKASTDYDVVLVYDQYNHLAGVFSEDYSFVNSVRYLCANQQFTPPIFTSPIRCVIIKYKDFLHKISIAEIMERYSNRI